jgi:pimeloyl-ACP methyl ester carboxylesterase
LVLIHGQVFDSTYFDAALPSFDARLILPDMPGYGASADELVGDFAGEEAQLETELRARVRGPVHLVGYSLGSYRALALALRGELQVASLTMLGPMAGEDRASLEARSSVGSALRSGQFTFVDAFTPFCFPTEFAASHPAAVAVARAAMRSIPVATLLEDLARLPSLPDLRPRLGEVKVPVLVRVGEQDPSTTVAIAEAIARALPNALLEIVPGTAHHYLGTDFEGTVASIKRFTGC